MFMPFTGFKYYIHGDEANVNLPYPKTPSNIYQSRGGKFESYSFQPSISAQLMDIIIIVILPVCCTLYGLELVSIYCVSLTQFIPEITCTVSNCKGDSVIYSWGFMK